MNFNFVYKGQLLLMKGLFAARKSQNWAPGIAKCNVFFFFQFR